MYTSLGGFLATHRDQTVVSSKATGGEIVLTTTSYVTSLLVGTCSTLTFLLCDEANQNADGVFIQVIRYVGAIVS